MQVDHNSFLLSGNVHTRQAVMRTTSAAAAGQVVDPSAVTSLRRALAFIRPELLDFIAWRRSAGRKALGPPLPWPR